MVRFVISLFLLVDIQADLLKKELGLKARCSIKMRSFFLSLFLFSSVNVFAVEDYLWRNEGSWDVRALERIPEEGLKILWWNIACSSTKGLKGLNDEVAYNAQPKNLWQNLRVLIKSEQKPDLIVLGEYCPRAFDQATYDQMDALYPYKRAIQKMSPVYKNRNGMRIFSKVPFDTVEEGFIKSDEIGNFPVLRDCDSTTKNGNTAFKQDFWKKAYTKVLVKFEGRAVSLLPVHLSNPWRIYRSCGGTFKAGVEILTGTENPNYSQAQDLIKKFQDEKSFVVFGDFNAPKGFFGSQSSTYRLLSSVWGESLIVSYEETYVDLFSSFGSHAIDHAFASSDIRATFAEVIPFAGSDHLPLYFVIE